MFGPYWPPPMHLRSNRNSVQANAVEADAACHLLHQVDLTLEVGAEGGNHRGHRALPHELQLDETRRAERPRAPDVVEAVVRRVAGRAVVVVGALDVALELERRAAYLLFDSDDKVGRQTLEVIRDILGHTTVN